MESALPTANRAATSTTVTNRRRGNRHRLSIPATLVAAGEPSITVTVTAMSVGGVGIQSATALKLDHNYSVESFDTLIPPGMKVRIVSQRPAADGSFEIGAKALQPA